MRVLSVGLIASLLVLFTDATVLEKRAVSAPVQTCLNDIALTSIAYDVYADKAATLNASSQYNEFILTFLKEVSVTNNISSIAIPHCCNSAVSTYTDEESNAVTNSVSALSGKAANAMQILLEKQPLFNSRIVVNALFEKDLGYLVSNTTKFGDCLSQRTPGNDLPALTQQLNQMNAAVKNAHDVLKAAPKVPKN